MGYTKPKETTRWHLENAALPNHAESYTVVSHGEVINNTYKLLQDNGFMVSRELYRASKNCNVAQGVYHIYPVNTTDIEIEQERELGMMFAWTNSYDKSKSFACAVGAYVDVCSNGMISGDMMNFKRKHRWSASRDIYIQMMDQIKSAYKYYKRLIQDKNFLKTVSLSMTECSELLGRLYVEEEILDSHQLTRVKKEMIKPTYNYSASTDTAWAFYNHVTHALKNEHPRQWIRTQQNFHDFITVELKGSPASKIMFEKPKEYEELGDTSQIIVDENSDMIIEVDEQQLQMDLDV
tara:strand:- start:11232 stop:12113 length:882 start_codon:yes stop_codon:yes gene_type:complete